MAEKQTHVLVVDDEAAISRALYLALTRKGFRATTALSGEAALDVVRREEVDAMIVDLRIPDMRGDVFFESAASVQPHLRQRTLFTTGDISEKAEELIEACKCPLLRKPFDLKDMLDWVRKVEVQAHDNSG